MAQDQQLDAACRSKTHRVKSFLVASLAAVLLVPNVAPSLAQQPPDAEYRVSAAQKLYSEKKWEARPRNSRAGPATQSAELDYLRGMALVHLERWQEARDAFSLGQRKAPTDARFLIERAGAEYRLRDFPAAKNDLGRALRLNPKTSIRRNFWERFICSKETWMRR